MRTFYGAAAATAAFALMAGFGGGFVVGDDGNGAGSSADRTAYSFAYSLDHHNFGRACSWIAQDTRGPADNCSSSLTYNTGFNMVLFGGDIMDGMHIVPGSRVDNPDGTVTYQMASDLIPPTPLTVAKGDNGLWRVVKIG